MNNDEKIINRYRAMIMAPRIHRGLAPKQVAEYEEAVLRRNRDDRVEMMMIYCALALKELLNFSVETIGDVLKYIDTGCLNSVMILQKRISIRSV